MRELPWFIISCPLQLNGASRDNFTTMILLNINFVNLDMYNETSRKSDLDKHDEVSHKCML